MARACLVPATHDLPRRASGSETSETGHTSKLPDRNETLRIPPRRIYGKLAVESSSLFRRYAMEMEVEARYAHAERDLGGDCAVLRLREPRPDPARRVAPPAPPLGRVEGETWAETRLRIETAMNALDRARANEERPPPPEQTIYFPDCASRYRDDTATVAAELDAWLGKDGGASTFDRSFGARWPALVRILLVLVAGAIGVLAALGLRLELVGGPSADSHPTLLLVRRLGPVRRVVAEVLVRDIADVRVVATGFGPFTFYRPAISIGKNRNLYLWPFGRLRSKRAIAVRDAVNTVLEARRAESASSTAPSPFR